MRNLIESPRLGSVTLTRMQVLLARAAMSVDDLAKALGVHRVTAHQWCAGGKRPRVEKIRPIANALGASVEAVIDALDADRAAEKP